jgi:hypothetical protein
VARYCTLDESLAERGEACRTLAARTPGQRTLVNGLFRASPHAYTPAMAFSIVLPNPSGGTPLNFHPLGDDEAEFEISSGGVLTITYLPAKTMRHFGVGHWIEVAVNTDPLT